MDNIMDYSEIILTKFQNKAPIVRIYGDYIVLAHDEVDYKIKVNKLIKGDIKGFKQVSVELEKLKLWK